MKIHPIKLNPISVFLIIIIGFMAYLDAAIASLYDSYQPGIELLKQFNSPHFLILFLAILYRIKNNKMIFDIAYTSAIGAIFISISLISIIAIHEPASTNWLPENERSMIKTLQISLLKPSFSGRSNAHMIGLALYSVASLTYLIYVHKKRV